MKSKLSFVGVYKVDIDLGTSSNYLQTNFN